MPGQLSEMLDQQFSEDSDFSRGVLPRRPDHIHSGRRERIARHHRSKSARSQIVLDEAMRKPGDAEPRHGGDSESSAVVRLEPPLRMNGDCLITVDELPGFRTLHECLMREAFVRCLGRSMLPDIVRTCDKGSMDWPDAIRFDTLR
jgi:hypothetical protein